MEILPPNWGNPILHNEQSILTGIVDGNSPHTLVATVIFVVAVTVADAGLTSMVGILWGHINL
jgi:hypothetical protein